MTLDELKTKRLNEVHKPCFRCKESGALCNTHEYVCGATISKYNACKNKGYIRNIRNLYVETLRQELKNETTRF